MSRLTKQQKLSLATALVNDSTKGRQAELKRSSQALFTAAHSILCPRKEMLQLAALSSSLIDKYLCKTSYINLSLSYTDSSKMARKIAHKSLREKYVELAKNKGRRYHLPERSGYRNAYLSEQHCSDMEGANLVFPVSCSSNQYYVQDAADPLFKALTEHLHNKYLLLVHREQLWIKCTIALQGVNTVKRLEEMYPELMPYLPKPEKEVKALVVSAEDLGKAIKCCQTGKTGDCKS